MKGLEVIVLCNGFIRRDGKVVLEAHSSSTLVKCEGHLIVVDTSSVEYRPRIVERLRRSGSIRTRLTWSSTRTTTSTTERTTTSFPKAQVLSGPLAKGEDPKKLFSGIKMVGDAWPYAGEHQRVRRGREEVRHRR